MNEWISFKDKKPECDIAALVFNEKGFMCGGDVIALYSHYYDIWRLYDPNYRVKLAVEVTHYFPIPKTPPISQDAVTAVKFAQYQVILDDWWLFGGTKWSRTRFRLKHPIIYSKRGLRSLWSRIQRIFVKPKMIQPLAIHPHEKTKGK